MMCGLMTSEAGTYEAALASADFVLGALSDGVTVQDAAGKVVYANDAAARICGFADARTMQATPAREIVDRFDVLDEHGDPVAMDRLPGRRVMDGEQPEPMLLRVRQRATGLTWWSLVRAHALCDDAGKPVLAVNIWHDASKEQRQRIAARFLAEATARLAESLDYAATLKAVAHALVPDLADWCTVDLVEDGVRRLLALAHVDPAKVEAAHAYRAKYPPDEGAPGGVPNVLRTGVPELYRQLTDEMLRSRAQSEEQWLALKSLGLESVMIVPIVVRGRTEGALTLIAAESGRLYDETDLALACELGRRAGTAIEHARAYASAQRAARARDEFLAVAGHELRTPLAALMLQIESMRSAVASGALVTDPDRFRTRIDKTFGHALRLARLVDGLLDVSRVAEGPVDLAIEDVDLAELVRETSERFTDDAARAGCELTVDAAVPCPGRWDPQRLEQVVSNLLSNAMKFGGGTPITVRCEARGDGYAVVVEDRGIGIAPEDHARIFGRFERAVSERNFPGLGLGLWITRELVSMHGGSVELTSGLGQGATFTVLLPRMGR